MALEPARVFTDREDPLRLVEGHLRELAKPSPVIQSGLINIFGVPGIGKTSLLRHLHDIYHGDDRLVTVGFDVADLGPDLGPAKLGFVERFRDYASARADELLPALHALNSADDTRLAAALAAVLQHFQRLNRPLLLILDAWDQAPEALFAWVERLLLLPLVRGERVLCILGSQGELRCRQFDVRQRVQLYALAPLDLDATIKQLAVSAELGRLVYGFTGGHPLANETVHEYLRSQHKAAAQEPEFFKQHRAEIARLVIDRIQSRVLAGITPELGAILRHIALFREFDIHTLRTVLPQFVESLRQRSDSSLLLSLKQLLDTRLVTWSDENRAYQLDPTVRRIFSAALRWADPERYADIRTAAEEYYDALIKDVPGNRGVYVVERFYHMLYNLGSESYNEAILREKLVGIINLYYQSPDGSYRDANGLERLEGTFRRDKELSDRCAELGLRRDTLERIVHTARQEP